MTEYYSHSVNLSNNQKMKFAKALQTRSPITLHLSNNELTGGDQMILTKTQDIRLSKTQVQNIAKQGGSLFHIL